MLRLVEGQERVSAHTIGSKDPWSVAASVVVYLVLASWLIPHPLPSPDYWWQVLAGRSMAETGRFLWTDSWTFTAGSRPWVNHEWLAELLMYAASQSGGLWLVHVLAILVVALAFWLAASSQRPGVSWGAVACGAVWGLSQAEGQFFFDVRPYLAGYLGLGCLLWGGDRMTSLVSRQGRVLLAIGFAIWANCHSSVLLGVGLLALGLGHSWWRGLLAARDAASSLAVVLVASACTPFGLSGLLLPFLFVKEQDFWVAHLNEWVPPDLLGRHLHFTLFWCATLLCAWVLRRRLSVSTWIPLLTVAVLSLRAWRHIPLFALVATPVWVQAAEGLMGGFTTLGYLGGLQQPRKLWVSLIGVLILMGRLYHLDGASLSMVRELFPVGQVAFLRSNALPPRLYNPYGWGGYLERHLAPTYLCFMDGRANTLFAEQTYRDFLSVSQGDVGWQTLLDRYGVEVVLTNSFEEDRAECRLSSLIRSSPRWQLVFADDRGDIFVRTEVVRRCRPRDGWCIPVHLDVERAAERAEGWLSKGGVDAAKQLLSVLLLERPDSAAVWRAQAVSLLRLGREPEALEATLRALALQPQLPYAHYNAAILYLRKGNRPQAVEHLRAELAISPLFAPARSLLGELETRP